MNCGACGNLIVGDKKFCTSCGTPVPAGTPVERVWMVTVDGRPDGPYSAGEIREKMRSGRIDLAAFVQREGTTTWIPALDVPEISGRKAATDTVIKRPPASDKTRQPRPAATAPVRVPPPAKAAGSIGLKAPAAAQTTCLNCGTEIRQEGKFCVKCGAPVQTRPGIPAMAHEPAIIHAANQAKK